MCSFDPFLVLLTMVLMFMYVMVVLGCDRKPSLFASVSYFVEFGLMWFQMCKCCDICWGLRCFVPENRQFLCPN